MKTLPKIFCTISWNNNALKKFAFVLCLFRLVASINLWIQSTISFQKACVLYQGTLCFSSYTHYFYCIQYSRSFVLSHRSSFCLVTKQFRLHTIRKGIIATKCKDGIFHQKSNWGFELIFPGCWNPKKPTKDERLIILVHGAGINQAQWVGGTKICDLFHLYFDDVSSLFLELLLRNRKFVQQQLLSWELFRNSAKKWRWRNRKFRDRDFSIYQWGSSKEKVFHKCWNINHIFYCLTIMISINFIDTLDNNDF